MKDRLTPNHIESLEANTLDIRSNGLYPSNVHDTKVDK